MQSQKIKKDIEEVLLKGKLFMYYFAINNNLMEETSRKKLIKLKAYKEFEKSITESNLSSVYQKWYSQSLLIIKQLLPDRLEEFKNLYHDVKRNSKDINLLTYSIYDFLLGLKLNRRPEIDSASACASKLNLQNAILNSCQELIDSKLNNIRGILQYELYENELETAKDILKKKHIRVAGALVGITLEGHLKQVCENHQLKLRKSHPTISEFNEILKENDIIDLPTWRLIQRLGDIRNMSVHAKEREPKEDEIEDLIRGCEKLIAELN